MKTDVQWDVLRAIHLSGALYFDFRFEISLNALAVVVAVGASRQIVSSAAI